MVVNNVYPFISYFGGEGGVCASLMDVEFWVDQCQDESNDQSSEIKLLAHER